METEEPTADNPPWTDMDMGTGRGLQGGSNGRRTLRQKQACSVGRRDERQRLVSGGWEKNSGGR